MTFPHMEGSPHLETIRAIIAYMYQYRRIFTSAVVAMLLLQRMLRRRNPTELTLLPPNQPARMPSYTYRGRRHGIGESSAPDAFQAQMRREDGWVLPTAVLLIDTMKAMTDLARAGSSKLQLVGSNIISALFSLCPAKTLPHPLATRLRRGVAHVPMPVIRLEYVPHRRICLLGFLLVAFGVLFLVASISTVLVGLVCILVLIGGHTLGLNEDRIVETPSAPEMGDAGQVAALLG